MHQLADTVRNSLNFYRMQESAESVDSGVVTGPAVAIDGFVARLVRAAASCRWSPRIVPVAAGDAPAARLTVAAGLGSDGA